MKRIIGTLILVVMVVFNLSFTSYAYTEEEKQQAKAWLSAHGYSPDMGGANQAYQDYLNGKFDEELGVDVNGDGIPAATEATTETTEESSTEEMTECDEEDNDTDNAKTDEDVEEVSGKSLGDVVKGSDESVKETTIEKDKPEQTGIEKISTEEIADEAVAEESTLYQPEKEGQYQEAAIVIVLAAILMLVAGVWMKYRK